MRGAAGRAGRRPLGWPFWALLALALAARLAFAVEVVVRQAGLDGLDPLDPWFYATSGQRILDGDYDLSGFQDELRARIQGGEQRLGFNTYLLSETGARTFRELYGEQPLLGGLLYNYLVAASLGLSGSTALLRWVQILVLNLASSWLVYDLTWRCTRDRRAALAAFALLAFHGASVAYAGFLLRTTLIAFVILLFVWFADGFRRRPGVAAALGLGASLGLVHLTKGISALCAPLWLGVLIAAPAGRAVRLRLAAVSLIGCLVVLTPLMLRNLQAGTALLHGGSQGHVGLVVYNFEGADGVTLIRPPNAYIDRILQASGGSQLGVLRHTIATHDSPLDYVGLELRKLRAFWNGSEGANNIDVASAPLWLRSLNALPIPTTALIALGLVGLVVTRRRAREFAVVWAGLAICLVVCLASISLARYRLPALPYMAVLGGVVCSALWQGPPARRLLVGGSSSGRRGLLVGLGVALVIAWPNTPPEPAHARLSRWVTSYQRQAPATAQAICARAIALHPLDALAPAAWGAADAARQASYLELHARHLDLCARTGDIAAQREALERLVAGYPQSAAVRERLERLDSED